MNNTCGVFLLHLTSGNVYIGQSVDVYNRINFLRRKLKFNEYEVFISDRYDDLPTIFYKKFFRVKSAINKREYEMDYATAVTYMNGIVFGAEKVKIEIEHKKGCTKSIEFVNSILALISKQEGITFKTNLK